MTEKPPSMAALIAADPFITLPSSLYHPHQPIRLIDPRLPSPARKHPLGYLDCPMAQLRLSYCRNHEDPYGLPAGEIGQGFHVSLHPLAGPGNDRGRFVPAHPGRRQPRRGHLRQRQPEGGDSRRRTDSPCAGGPCRAIGRTRCLSTGLTHFRSRRRLETARLTTWKLAGPFPERTG